MNADVSSDTRNVVQVIRPACDGCPTSTYSVTGYDLNGCHTTSSKVVNVESLPVINVSGTKTICAGQSTTLTPWQ